MRWRWWSPLTFLALILILLTASLPCESAKRMDGRKVEWVRMESNERQEAGLRISGHGVTWGQRVDPNTPHECTFYLRNPRQQEMEELLKKISDPTSPQYGKHLSREELRAMTHNAEGERILVDYLQSIGASIVSQRGDTVTASAPVGMWERALHTELFHVRSEVVQQDLVRAHGYFLPREVAAHVATVTHVVDLPVPIHHGPGIIKNRPHRSMN